MNLKNLIEKINRFFSKRPRPLLAAMAGVSFVVAIYCGLRTPQTALADNTSPYQLAPQQPNFYRVDTNSATYAFTNSTTSTTPLNHGVGTGPNTNSLNLTLRQNIGLSIFLIVWDTNSVSSAATSTNYSVYFDTTPDNTNYTCGPGAYPIGPLTCSMAGGVGTNMVWTNVPATALNNVRSIQPGKIVWTGSNNVFAELIYSYSGQ